MPFSGIVSLSISIHNHFHIMSYPQLSFTTWTSNWDGIVCLLCWCELLAGWHIIILYGASSNPPSTMDIIIQFVLLHPYHVHTYIYPSYILSKWKYNSHNKHSFYFIICKVSFSSSQVCVGVCAHPSSYHPSQPQPPYVHIAFSFIWCSWRMNSRPCSAQPLLYSSQPNNNNNNLLVLPSSSC